MEDFLFHTIATSVHKRFGCFTMNAAVGSMFSRTKKLQIVKGHSFRICFKKVDDFVI